MVVKFHNIIFNFTLHKIKKKLTYFFRDDNKMSEREGVIPVPSSDQGAIDHLQINISLGRIQLAPNLQPIAMVFPPQPREYLADVEEPTLESLGVELRADHITDLPTPNLPTPEY